MPFYKDAPPMAPRIALNSAIATCKILFHTGFAIHYPPTPIVPCKMYGLDKIFPFWYTVASTYPA